MCVVIVKSFYLTNTVEYIYIIYTYIFNIYIYIIYHAYIIKGILSLDRCHLVSYDIEIIVG